MSEATPRPWHLHPSGRANVLDLYTVFYGHGETASNQICQAEKDNATLIVRAVNAHDALVAACEAILETNGLTDKESEAREKARAALTLARDGK